MKPLYVFKNGNSLDFDLGVSAGLAFASYDKYRHDRESDCYPVTKRSQSGVHPVVSDLHVGFVYRLGSYPVTKKYRWRYDCDQVYRDRIDSIYAAKKEPLPISVTATVLQLLSARTSGITMTQSWA